MINHQDFVLIDDINADNKVDEVVDMGHRFLRVAGRKKHDNMD